MTDKINGLTQHNRMIQRLNEKQHESPGTRLLFILLIFSSCREDMPCYRFNFGSETVFLADEPYCAEDMELTLQLEEINESCCPEGVVCVWAGQVTVSFDLKGAVEGKVQLASLMKPADTVGNYSFRLVRVDPYPKYKQPLERSDYRITMKVDKLN